MQPELPVQAQVEEPIINNPYDEPKQHWKYDKQGKAHREPDRRPAEYFWTTQRVMTGQLDLEGVGAGDSGSERLDLVNRLREDVARWRESNYENATQATKKLLRHWRSPDRKRRFFFCQIEAVETVIYLRELLAAGRTRRGKASVSREEYLALLNPSESALERTAKGEFVARLSDPPLRENCKALTRYGCKMATGSGKTVVMAMLTAWALCNRGAVPGDTRFPRAVLAVCPNLTVKERLQVLRPDYGSESYYEKFDIVPSQMRPLMLQGRVMITNWHAFAPESEHVDGGKNYAVVNKGDEGADAFSRRVLKELYDLGEVLVLNDEAHHAYRPAPPEIAAKSKRKRNADIFGEASKEDAEEATVWVEGLDKINQTVGVACCVDLSATPFYLAGSGWIEGSPFPWLVSDFGLVDAIESGITKIPRLPVSDESGKPDPKFFRLWEEIKKQCQPAQLDKGKPKPDATWLYAGPALSTLGSQWQERFQQQRDAKPGQTVVPPVMIVVCDNTDIAQVFFEKISGETQEEITDAEGEDENEGDSTEPKKKAKIKKIRRFNSAGLPFPELANSPDRTVTLRIDSKLLAEAEAGEGSTKLQEAEKLRQIIASVGQPGTPGEHIRCVVSVQMLTEGWDANNVTQILGLRAFGSQLLCEQVVGRGLRRISYDVDPETGMLRPEYADVYGIPFSVIPFKGRASEQPELDDRPVTQVKALPERAAMEIRFPNVEGYVFELKRNHVRCDLPKVEALRIRPMQNPMQVFVQPQVGVREGHVGSPSFKTELQNRDSYYENHHLQTILFEITRQIVTRLTDTQDEKRTKFRYQARHELFPQVARIVEAFAETRVDWSSATDRRELGLQIYADQVVERLCEAIEPDTAAGEPPLLPVINRFSPHGSTADVLFNTTRPCHPTQKSHVDHVVLDTDTWERSAAFTIEASEHVAFYSRNDDGGTSHLGFGIPYEFYGQAHLFYPDFVVRLKSGTSLVVEIKGMVGEQEEAKSQAAKRWISAVNNWGRMGTWAFHVCRDPQLLGRDLAYHAGKQLATNVPAKTSHVEWPTDDTALIIPVGHRAKRQSRPYLEDLVLALLALGRGALPLERLIAACRLLSDHQRLRQLATTHDAALTRSWKKSKPEPVQRGEFRPVVIGLCKSEQCGMFRSVDGYEVRMIDQSAWTRQVAESPEAAAFVLADARFAKLVLDLEAISASDDELWLPTEEAAELVTQ
ncbi:MAG TPA: DEAD/DEAH box helicase family protein [Chthoniobacter sp.]|jgi:type III restriction enzyme